MQFRNQNILLNSNTQPFCLSKMQDLEHEFGGEPSEYYIWLHQMFYEDIEVTITFVGVHAPAKRRYQKAIFKVSILQWLYVCMDTYL